MNKGVLVVAVRRGSPPGRKDSHPHTHRYTRHRNCRRYHHLDRLGRPDRSPP